jgi:hypothetical protein
VEEYFGIHFELEGESNDKVVSSTPFFSVRQFFEEIRVSRTTHSQEEEIEKKLTCSICLKACGQYFVKLMSSSRGYVWDSNWLRGRKNREESLTPLNLGGN